MQATSPEARRRRNRSRAVQSSVTCGTSPGDLPANDLCKRQELQVRNSEDMERPQIISLEFVFLP